MERIKKLFEVDFATVKKHLDAFSSLDTHRTGRVSLAEFCGALGVVESPELRRLFNLLDVDHSGSLDFREYLLGLAVPPPPLEPGACCRASKLTLVRVLAVAAGERAGRPQGCPKVGFPDV